MIETKFTDDELYCMTLKDFKIIKKIGDGSIGNIYKAEYKDNIYALKFIYPKYTKTVYRGLLLSKDLHHPNLMKFYGHFVDIIDNERYIITILEYIEGSDLHTIYSTKSNLYIRTVLPTIITQVGNGLKYIHSLGIIHRDIKLENIVVTNNNQVKIIDYDFMIKIGDSIDRCGTPYYVSPETIEGVWIDSKSDIWSLGVVIYCILVGDYPFDGDTDEELFDNICFNSVDTTKLPKKYKILVSNMLEKNPIKRIGLDEVLEMVKDL